MDRIYLSAGIATPPSPPAGSAPQYPTDGSPGVTPATAAGAHWYYMTSQEQYEVIIAAGLTPDKSVYTQLRDAIQIITVRSGMVAYFAMSSAPSGWLKANGSTISRATYARLFTAIGTTFGAGDGSTTFSIPELRGEFLRCWDDSRGVDSARTLGSAQGDLVKTHQHNVYGQLGGASGSLARTLSVGSTVDDTTSANNAGGGAENRPRNIALLACIKT